MGMVVFLIVALVLAPISPAFAVGGRAVSVTSQGKAPVVSIAPVGNPSLTGNAGGNLISVSPLSGALPLLAPVTFGNEDAPNIKLPAPAKAEISDAAIEAVTEPSVHAAIRKAKILEASVQRVEENFTQRGWDVDEEERSALRKHASKVLQAATKSSLALGGDSQARLKTMEEYTVALPKFIPGRSPRANLHLTGLFRHKEKWLGKTRQALRKDWIPAGKRDAAKGEKPRIVLRSLGASVGLEPLSLAMLVDTELKRAGENPDEWDIRIDAMDINPAALVFMTLGRHKAERVEDIVPGPYADTRAPDLMRDARSALGRRAKSYLAPVKSREGWYELTAEFAPRFARWLNPVWMDLTDVELRPVVDDAQANGVFAMGIHGVLPSFTRDVQPWLEKADWKRSDAVGMLTTTVAEKSFWERRDAWVSALRLVLALTGWRILSTPMGRFKFLKFHGV